MNSSSKKTMLFTPCRRVGLNRKRSKTSTEKPANVLTGQSPSPYDFTDKRNDSNESLTLVNQDCHSKQNNVVVESVKRTYNDVEDESMVNDSPRSPSTKETLEIKKQKLSNTEPSDSVQKKFETIPVSINITRCDLEATAIKALLSKNTEKAEQEEAKTSSSKEVNTSQNECTETKESSKQYNSSKPAEVMSEEESLLDNNSDSSNSFHSPSRRRKKKSVSNKHRKQTPKLNAPKKNNLVRNNVQNIMVNSSQTTSYDSDSEDDFVVKSSRDRKKFAPIKNETGNQSGIKEEKETKKPRKMIKKTIADELNKTDHIRIAENKSYTIIHKGNIISYVKSHDNDVNLKTTESDDNLQPNASSDICPSKKTMIVEQKNYMSRRKTNAELEAGSGSSTSMFDSVLESIKLKDEIQTLNRKIKSQKDKLESLKRLSIYKKQHNVDELQSKTLKIKQSCQDALIDLLILSSQHSAVPIDMNSLLRNIGVPHSLVGYNEAEDSFIT